MSSARDYPRRRVALACEVCRLRKTRCDAKKPSCSLCIELEIECVYNKPSTGKRTRDTSPDATRTAQRLNRIEASLRNISSALGITQTHVVVGTPQSQLTEHLSTPSASFPSDSRHRYGCKMPNLLVFKAPDADSTPWSYDCTENFFSEQLDQMADMRRALRKPTQNHDLSPVEARRLQRSFAENSLRWVPLFDHATASAHLESMKVSSSDRTSSSQCLVLLMYAIGAIAADSSVYVQSSGDLPGFHFYCEAYAILESFSYPSKDLCTIQCWALATVYLLIAMRPLEAWRTISQASQNCILLLKAGIGRETVHSADLFNRIYWICYVLENELEVCLELTPSGLRAYEVLVPLPTSHYEEEGMYYLLALSSLRKLMVEVVDTVGLRSSNIVPYAPVVALELRKQIDDWYQHLPGSLQFPLDHSLLFDSRKAYLRCQYFALIAVVSWPFVFKCTNNSFEMEYSISNDESDPIANGARECLKAARNYLKAAEEILTEKSLASHLVIRGYFATTIILLLVYPASAAASQDLTEDRNFLQQALRNLAYWKIVPFMQQPLLQMERIARLKGLVDDGKANAQMEIL